MGGIDLTSLLSPTTIQGFLASSWGRRPFLVHPTRPDRFEGLLNLAEFEFLMSAVATPGWVGIVKDVNRPPSREQLTRDGTIDVAGIQKAIEANHSLLLNKVHRLHPATGKLCRQLTADFRSAGVVLRRPIRANAYYTPPHSQGFAPHYDDHEVLVMQLHGTKLWRIHKEVKWPRKPMGEPLGADAISANPQEITLHTGDVFYLPRGFVHEALATDGSSLHVTLSIEAANWSHVLERLIDLEDRLGEPLPIGFCSGGVPQASDRARVGEIGGNMISWPALNRAIADIYNSTFLEGDLPPDGLLTRAESNTRIELDTYLATGDGIFANLELDGDAVILRLAGAALRAEKSSMPLFRSVCNRKPFRLRDLGSPPDALALMDLALELIKRGVLVVTSNS